jgi:subtilase family serine protease
VGVTAPTAGAQPNAGAQPAAGAQPTGSALLPGTAAPDVSQTPSAGPVSPRTTVQFEVALNPRDPVGAQALATAVATPGSTEYRRFLTPAQWEARFSPTTAQVGQVTAWLRHEGLRVGSISADRLAIDVSGTSSRVERAFDTTLDYHVVDGNLLRLATRDVSVPSTLAAIVAGTVGINETPSTPRRSVAGSGRAGGRRAAGASRTTGPPLGQVDAPPCGSFYGQAIDTTDPPYGGGYGSAPPDVVCGYTPPQMRSAYGIGTLVAKGTDGTGQTVAVIDAYASPTLFSDAEHYSTVDDPAHVLAPSQFHEVVARKFNDQKRCDAGGWYGEQALDVEAVHAMAPGAGIVYVGAKNCLSALYDSLRTVVDHHLADVVDASWGDDGGDLLDDAGIRRSVDNTLTMAAGTGVSVVFASGDNGDEFAALGVDAPDYPASSPWATAVGGATLQAGIGVGEIAWSTATSNLCTAVLTGLDGCGAGNRDTWLATSFDEGSGGGTSYDYTQPDYQVGVVPPAMATAHAASVGPAPMRVEPDISMDADPGTGLLEGVTQQFADGVHYGAYRTGGTSLSAPLFAGMVALADQAAGGSLGFLNPLLYDLHSNDPSVITDIVPRGKLAQIEVSYANSVDASGGLVTTTRIDDYQGPETYCPATGSCITRDIVLSTADGYDDMTGLGTPGLGFVPALAALGRT